MAKPVIKTLQTHIATLEDNLKNALEQEGWQSREIGSLRDRIKLADVKIEELTRDKNWLKQLCAEQSSSIAGYMRSR